MGKENAAMPEDAGEQDARDIATRYRKQAAETGDPVKRQELEAYADDIEAKLFGAEQDQQEG